jgi:hypothetical protein
VKLKQLIDCWEESFAGPLTEETYSIRLPVEDAAKVEALAEMYPRRTKENIITDLLSAALNELLSGIPYVQGKRVIGRDELGDPIYEDIGPTPRYLDLARKHLHQRQQQGNIGSH